MLIVFFYSCCRWGCRLYDSQPVSTTRYADYERQCPNPKPSCPMRGAACFPVGPSCNMSALLCTKAYVKRWPMVVADIGDEDDFLDEDDYAEAESAADSELENEEDADEISDDEEAEEEDQPLGEGYEQRLGPQRAPLPPITAKYLECQNNSNCRLYYPACCSSCPNDGKVANMEYSKLLANLTCGGCPRFLAQCQRTQRRRTPMCDQVTLNCIAV